MNGFTVWVGIGAALGLWRVARSAPQRQANVWINVGLGMLFAALIGARLFYVGLNHAYFARHLLEIPQIWLGGLAWPGAVGASWLALLYLTITYRTPRGIHVSPGWLGDHLYPLLPPLSISTWLGCWMSGSAYGPALPAGRWWGVPSLDESGAYSLHWPLQPLAAFSLLVYFWFLETRIKPLHPPGRLSGLAGVGLLLHLLAASMLRADPAPTWRGLRMETWMALAYLAGFTILAFFAFVTPRLWRKSSDLNPIDP